MTAAMVKTVKYIDGILTHKDFYEYIPMEKTLCRSYMPPTVNIGK